jgi:uncharacterized protein
LPELICNTSPLQYLHQLGLIELLHAIAPRVIVPRAVLIELEAGKLAGIDEPSPELISWISILDAEPSAAPRWTENLGAGESEVLSLTLATPQAVAILDDRLARRVAARLGLKFTGTLGILLDGKRLGRVAAIAPLLDQLRNLGFRVSPRACNAVLKAAGENA